MQSFPRAQTFSEDDLKAFLALNYCDLYQAVGKWDVEASKRGIVEDSFPPNFHTLVTAALAPKASTPKDKKKPASKND